MNFSETLTLESISAPGVTVTLRRLGALRRIDLDTVTLPYRQRRRHLELEYPSNSKQEDELERQLEIARQKVAAVPANETAAVIDKDLRPLEVELAAASTLETKQKRTSVNMEYSLLEGLIRCELIRASVVSIVGGDFDGMSGTELLEFGPPALTTEIYEKVSTDTRLQGAPAKNSGSPTTSVAVDKATPESSNAPPAEAHVAAGT